MYTNITSTWIPTYMPIVDTSSSSYDTRSKQIVQYSLLVVSVCFVSVICMSIYRQRQTNRILSSVTSSPSSSSLSSPSLSVPFPSAPYSNNIV